MALNKELWRLKASALTVAKCLKVSKAVILSMALLRVDSCMCAKVGRKSDSCPGVYTSGRALG